MLTHEPSQREIYIRKRSENAEFLGHPPEQDVPAEAFEQLVAEFPDYAHPNRFNASWISMKLPRDHSELGQLLSRVTELGLTPQKHSADLPAQVKIRDYSGFSAEEIESADYVECQRFNPFIATASEHEPQIVTRISSDSYIKQCKNREIGSFVNLYHLLAVRGAAKTALEEANLKGLELLPLVPDSGEWPSDIEPLHLIWSSHELPEVDGDLYVDSDYEIFRSVDCDTRDQRRQCYLLDGYEVAPQLRYTGLNEDGFDVGITREWLGGKSDHYRKLIFSQRARSVLEKIDRKFHYRPVKSNA